MSYAALKRALSDQGSHHLETIARQEAHYDHPIHPIPPGKTFIESTKPPTRTKQGAGPTITNPPNTLWRPLSALVSSCPRHSSCPLQFRLITSDRIAPVRTSLLVLIAIARLACAAVDNPVCDKTGPATYKLSFELSGPREQVAVYASTSPDHIDSRKVLARATSSPIEVTAHSAGRIYFHLKPRSGHTRVVAVRRIEFEGTYNTRDIGGYRATDGRYVRWGMVYRSDQLHDLTEHDFQVLTALGLKLVCDFRLDAERNESPTDTAKLPTTKFASLTIDSYGGRYGQPRAASASGGGRGASGRGGPAPPPQPYNWLPLAAPQYSKVFHSIAAGDLPVLFHCFAGKDRTGMMAGLILSVLGVPRDVILNDYMITNEIPATKLPVIARGKIRRGDAATDLETVRRGAQVTRGQMEATFAMIDKTYGSVTAYLQKEMYLTPADLTTIHSRLLEQ